MSFRRGLTDSPALCSVIEGAAAAGAGMASATQDEQQRGGLPCPGHARLSANIRCDLRPTASFPRPAGHPEAYPQRMNGLSETICGPWPPRKCSSSCCRSRATSDASRSRSCIMRSRARACRTSDAAEIVDELAERGVEVRDDCGRSDVGTTRYSNGELASSTTDALTLFMREAGRYQLLTPEEEVELAQRIEGGDAEAKERMINSNLRLVVSIARNASRAGGSATRPDPGRNPGPDPRGREVRLAQGFGSRPMQPGGSARPSNAASSEQSRARSASPMQVLERERKVMRADRG